MKPIQIIKGFIEIESKDPYMRSFMVATDDGPSRVNVWQAKNGTYTVGTHVNHPKKGPNQLFRRNCTRAQVMELLKKPRKHTGKGYRKK